MKQALALEIMLSGENVFLTGAAGSGKTFTLNQFIKLAKNSGKKVSITATTGLAATHLGGNTIHAWSGIGIYDYLSKKFFEKIPKNRAEIIKNTDILVIDEFIRMPGSLPNLRFAILRKITVKKMMNYLKF